MSHRFVMLTAATLLLAAAPATRADDARDVLTAASRALGADTLHTLRYAGSGFSFVFGQSAAPGAPWPRYSARDYVRDIDFDLPASHVQFVRTSVDTRGGSGVGLPIRDQPQNQFIPANAAWPLQVDIWLTPQGFLKRALGADSATVRTASLGGRTMHAVSFAAGGTYTVTGYIDEQHRVEKVETWLEHPALGDMSLAASFSDYREFGGLLFPSRIVQTQGGFPVFDLTITAVTPNAPVTIDVPQRGGGPPPGIPGNGGLLPGGSVRSIEAASGVFYIIGGPNNSIAVEFKDFIVMIEAPQTEDRSLAFMAEAKARIPGKPIRYLVNTHHHFDHSGGLRTFAAEGATIVTHALNLPYYRTALASPHTLAPDLFARAGRPMNIETLTEKRVISDGSRTLEIHLVKDTTHSDGSVMAYLPVEKLLVEGDIFDQPGPGVPALTEGPLTALNLVENIERLHLDVERLLPVHAPDVVPISELYTRAGRSQPGAAR